jgi:hypothetical protein
MRLCPYCGHPTYGGGLICRHHMSAVEGDDWARTNRTMCDFVHRGIVAPATATALSDSLDTLFARFERTLAA